MINLKKGSVLILFIVITLVVGSLGSITTDSSVDSWYNELIKPALAPPNWVFAPVWTTLFVLMAVAAFLVWNQDWKKKEVRMGINLYFVQLGLNFLWSFLFFGLKNPLAAFVEIIILWVFILLTMIWFNKSSRMAMWLFLPYIVWVSFSAILNFSFWLLNSGLL